MVKRVVVERVDITDDLLVPGRHLRDSLLCEFLFLWEWERDRVRWDPTSVGTREGLRGERRGNYVTRLRHRTSVGWS